MELTPNATKGWLKYVALFADLFLRGGAFIKL